MSEIIIGGVSIHTLKAQRDAMRKDAVKFVSDNIDGAKALIEELLELTVEEYDKVDSLASQANELLEAAKLVSDVTGVTYFLPYSEEWGDNGDVFTRRLEEADEGALSKDWDEYPQLVSLFSTLENMESESSDWHTSRC